MEDILALNVIAMTLKNLDKISMKNLLVARDVVEDVIMIQTIMMTSWAVNVVEDVIMIQMTSKVIIH